MASKLSNTKKIQWTDPVFRAMMLKANRKSLENRKKLSDYTSRLAETVEKGRLTQLKNWKDPILRVRMLAENTGCFRNGHKRQKNKKCCCRYCGWDFLAVSSNASICPECLFVACSCGCGRVVKRPSLSCWGHASRVSTSIMLEGRKRQGLAISGECNPAKRRSVGRKISQALKNGGHWTFKSNRNIIRGKIARRKGTTTGVSLLENLVAKSVPWMERYVRIGFYQVDFCDRKARVVLEVQGCWWHACKKCYPNEVEYYKQQEDSIRNDKSKLTYLRNRGWIVFYLWEHQVKEKSDVLCYSKIRVLCGA